MAALDAGAAQPAIGPVSGKRIAVLGAGMVGVCCALELQARGAAVTLIDRKAPGAETSYGNAGVLARSSLAPLNNPALFGALPGLIGNRRAPLRYDPLFLMRNARWAAGFLAAARPARFLDTARALDGLIKISIDAHRRMISECGLSERLSAKGWIFLYRSVEAYERSAPGRAAMAAHDVETEVLVGAALQEHEPGLAPIFPRAVWVKDSWSVDDPGAVVEGYAAAFQARGGAIRRSEARAVHESDDAAIIRLDGDEDVVVDHAALCLGPWAKSFLEASGFSVRMAFERGYHQHFSGRRGDGSNLNLSRPICDTSGGYVLSPMRQGLRLTTGVELAALDAPPRPRQLEQATRAARDAIDLGDAMETPPWLGSRPTFPDSRPAIGFAPGARRVSLAVGHQHIGFATGAGTGRLLADILEGATPPVDAAPFRPERFIRRRARR